MFLRTFYSLMLLFTLCSGTSFVHGGPEQSEEKKSYQLRLNVLNSCKGRTMLIGPEVEEVLIWPTYGSSNRVTQAKVKMPSAYEITLDVRLNPSDAQVFEDIMRSRLQEHLPQAWKQLTRTVLVDDLNSGVEVCILQGSGAVMSHMALTQKMSFYGYAYDNEGKLVFRREHMTWAILYSIVASLEVQFRYGLFPIEGFYIEMVKCASLVKNKDGTEPLTFTGAVQCILGQVLDFKTYNGTAYMQTFGLKRNKFENMEVACRIPEDFRHAMRLSENPEVLRRAHPYTVQVLAGNYAIVLRDSNGQCLGGLAFERTPDYQRRYSINALCISSSNSSVAGLADTLLLNFHKICAKHKRSSMLHLLSCDQLELFLNNGYERISVAPGLFKGHRPNQTFDSVALFRNFNKNYL